MLIQNAGELHHVKGGFGAKDFGELGIGDDAPFVLGVLELVLFDVFPDFFGDFTAGELFIADDGFEFGRKSHGGGESAAFFSARSLGFFNVGSFRVIVVFGFEIIEGINDDIAVWIV